MWPVLLKPPQFYLLFGHIWAPDPIYSYDFDISIWLFHWYFNLKKKTQLTYPKTNPESTLPESPASQAVSFPFPPFQ